MYVSEADFDRYKSDFYLGGLGETARQATEASMSRLRSFALNVETCRRKSLLDYFNERPEFGERCGTCDVCLSHKIYGDDAQRDFGPFGARIVLLAIDSLSGQSLSTILKVIAGSVVEPYRYKPHLNPNEVQAMIGNMKAKMVKQFPSNYYRDLVAQLVQKGFLQEATKSAKASGFQKTWTTYLLSLTGENALKDPTVLISLPVPDSIREADKLEEERRQRVLSDLTTKGLKLEKIPQEELEAGDGDVVRAYAKWYSHLDGVKRAGREERFSKLEALLAAVEKWRAETAIKQRMAPASVLSEHVLVSIAYATATLAPGMKLDKDSIVAAGVRNREVDSLVGTLATWVDEAQPTRSSTEVDQIDALMILGETHSMGATPWPHAVYKPVKKTGVAVWEASYIRFMAGESPLTIAMSPEAGKKPIQVKTVVGHLLDAIVFGRNVDLRRLSAFMKPPTKREWEALSAAELSTGIDVCGDPEKSGRNGESFSMSDFLRPVVGDTLVYTPWVKRSYAENELFLNWCDLLKWYISLRRAGCEPSFVDKSGE
jgi:hypothetical protein